jgi:hypothetical protein
MKKLTTAKEYWAEYEQLNARVENTLHSLTLRHGKIDFTPHGHQLENDMNLTLAGLEVVNEVYTHIVVLQTGGNRVSWDIMSTRFTLKDRMRALEIAEVVLQVDNFYNEAKKQYGDTLKRLADS